MNTIDHKCFKTTFTEKGSYTPELSTYEMHEMKKVYAVENYLYHVGAVTLILNYSDFFFFSYSEV